MSESSWPMPDRRQSDMRLVAVEKQVDDLRIRVGCLEDTLDENTALTEQIAEDTRGIREVMHEGVSAVKFLCRMALVWKFSVRYVLLPALGLGLLAYYFSHDYHFPAWFDGLRDLVK